MKAEINRTVEVKLTLTLEEACWLRDLVRNPIRDIESESRETALMRSKFFSALIEQTARGSDAVLIRPTVQDPDAI